MITSEPNSEAAAPADGTREPASVASEPRTTNHEPRTSLYQSPTLAIALGLLLAAIVVAVYYPVVDYKLLTWDDDQHITENEYFHPLTWMNVLHFWGYSFIYMYIPVSYNFYALEIWVAGFFPSADPADKLNPAVFHLGGLLLHLGCTLWAYRLMLRLVPYAPAALCGAALFAIHPLQVESVCWVGETRGTLATFFSFAAVWFYLKYAGVDPQEGLFAAAPYEPPVRRTRDAVFGFLLFVLALLSKPSASSLPLLVLLLDVVLLRHAWKRSLVRLVPWFLAGGVIMGLTKYYQNDDVIHWASLKPWHQRPLVAGDAYAFYLGKLIWPFNLAFDYGRTPHYAAESPMFYRAWIAPLLLVVASIVLPRRRVWLGCYGLFLLALLPVSGIVPFIYQNISTVADRYMYVPMFGLGLLLAAWIASRKSHIVPLGVSALVLGLCAGRSIEQCETWRDDWNVYANGIRVNPLSHMANLNLGNRYKDAGHYEAAMRHYRRVVELRPDYAWAYVHIGSCSAKLGHYDDAAKAFQTAINLDQKFVEAMFGMAEVAKVRGDFAMAEKWYRDAVKAADEEESDPHTNLGELLLEQSTKKDGPERERYEKEGIAEFTTSLKIEPGRVEAYRRYGRALVAAGHVSEGAKQLEKAVELAPENAQALTDLGSCYLSLGKLALAVEMTERAVRKNPNLLEARTNRALALASAGKPNEARAEYEQALKLIAPGAERAAEIRRAMAELK